MFKYREKILKMIYIAEAKKMYHEQESELANQGNVK